VRFKKTARRLLLLSPFVMVTEGPIDEREHAVGEEVLVEELRTVYLTVKKGVEAQNSGAPVSSED
jgi:hypothetical protein